MRAKPLARAPLCPPDANSTTLPPHTSANFLLSQSHPAGGRKTLYIVLKLFLQTCRVLRAGGAWAAYLSTASTQRS